MPLVPIVKRIEQSKVTPQPIQVSGLDPSDVIQESMLVASWRLNEFVRQEQVSFYVWLRSLTFERLREMRRVVKALELCFYLTFSR